MNLDELLMQMPEGRRGAPFTPSEQGIPLLVAELEQSERRPPAKDPHLKAYYISMQQLLANDKDFRDYIAGIMDRRGMTAQNMSGLVWCATQFEMLFSDHEGYPQYPRDFREPQAWSETIKRLLNESSLFDAILEFENIKATRPRRYGGPHALLHEWYGTDDRSKDNPDEQLRIVDACAGGGHYLCLNSASLLNGHSVIDFGKIHDYTPDGLIKKYAQRPLPLGPSMSFDLKDPLNPVIRKWRASSSNYPQRSHRVQQYMDKEEALYRETIWNPDNPRPIDVRIADILQLERDLRIGQEGGITPHSFDGAIVATALYQMPHNYLEAVSNLSKLLKPDGLIIVADNARVPKGSDGRELTFDGQLGMDYRIHVIGNATGGKFIPVIGYDTPRAYEAFPLEGYDWFMQTARERNKGNSRRDGV